MLKQALLSFAASLAFLTRLPLGYLRYQPLHWRWAKAWFVLSGACLGGLYWLVFCALQQHLSLTVSLVITLGVSVWITGAIHEDGLADTLDALGGQGGAEQRLHILKDSRLGTYGVLGLILCFALKLALLLDLAQGETPCNKPHLLWGFLLGQSLSRGILLFPMLTLPYVSTASKSTDMMQLGKPQVVVAAVSALTLLLLAWLLGIKASALGVMLLTLLLLNLFLAWQFKRIFKGITGDLLGCAQQLSEITILLCLAQSALSH